MCVFVQEYITTISPFIYLPFYFFAATTKCLYKRHLFPTTSAQIKTSYVYYVPVVLLLLLPIFLSLSLSLCLRSGVPHTTISPFLYLPFYFFAATTKCLYKRHLLPTRYFPSGKYYFSICDYGPDSLHAVIGDKLTFFTGGCSEGLGAFRFF